MILSRRLAVLLAVLLSPLLAWSQETAIADQLEILTRAGLKSDTPSLLDFFRRRTLSPAERTRLASLVQQLGAAQFQERNEASQALIAAGRQAIPFLTPALKDPDPEIARRARWCLRGIDPQPETAQVLAAARVLAAREVDGALDVLLDYLPFLEEDSCEEDLYRIIASLIKPQAKPPASLLRALKSASPRQRTAAGWTLARSARETDRDLAIPLLRDEEPLVRLRIAESLLWGRDRRGVEPLVGLLEKTPLEVAIQAESLLFLLAGDRSPAPPLGNTATERRAAAVAWQRWYEEHGNRIDLARIGSDLLLGLRLIVANGGYGGGGAVWELGSDRKERWQLRKVGGPFDARILPGGRILLAEYNDRRVSERDRLGKILWEYRPPNSPLEVQRLANGNTLVTTNYEILEVTRDDHRIVFQYKDATGNIFSGQKLSNGHILLGLYSGFILELDGTGKEVNRFAIERPRGLASIVTLPGNRILLPLAGSNRIVEMDRNGKVLRETPVVSPTTIALLPGGNLLVGSHILNNVREIDRTGKVLWEQRAEGQIFRVRVR